MSNKPPAAEATLDTRPVNPFALQGVSTGPSAQVAIASSRQAQEVQAAMAIAKRFPRNQEEAWNRIAQSCKRKGLAECAMYAYPKGGTTVTGPSIRLAEELARSWGNIDFGIVELEQKNGESTVMTYAWDLETNTRQTKIFQVQHQINKKNGEVKVLTDPREIYEMAANYGARRLRACILGVIPGDIVDMAVEECEKTLQGGNKEPLIDRLRRMAVVFQEEFQVSVAMLEKRLGHKLDATTEPELVGLKKVYRSLRDGMAGREQFFETVDAVQPAEVSTTNAPSTPEAGQVSDGPGPSSSPASPGVPNETLGAEKRKAARKGRSSPPPAAQEASEAPGRPETAETAPDAPQSAAPAKATPPAQAPQPGSRQEKVQILRDWLAENGATEAEFLKAAFEMQAIGVPAQMLASLGGDVLQAMIDRYAEIVSQIQ